MSNHLVYATNHDGGGGGGGSVTAAASKPATAVDKPMSIKDRIRAMNLIAEKSLTNNNAVNVASSRSKFSIQNGPRPSNGTIACDLLTLDRNDKRDKQRKPAGLSSDPGVGNDKEAATRAINKWRSRRGDDMTKKSAVENDIDDDKDNIEWTIFDLTKGGSKRSGSSSSPVRCTSTSMSTSPKHGKNDAIDNSSSKVMGSRLVALNSTTPAVDTIRISSGKKSPNVLSQINNIHHQRSNSGSDFGFVMPKLKPVRRAPRTLELVNTLTSPERKLDSGHKNTEKSGPCTSESHVFDKEKNEGIIAPHSYSVNLKKVEQKSMASREVIDNKEGREGSLKTVATSKSNIAAVPRRETAMSINSQMQTVDNKMYLKLTQHEAMATSNLKKKVGTPQRSKISDRIKAFSSAANGSSWKYQSPARNLVLPPASSGSSSIKKILSRDRPNHGEDSSCASSEKQSVDDDSISVSTPMANSTPARLGAQPPTPNSYNSEAAYTSIASSGDGAVAGSFASSEPNQSTQLQYTHVSTPGSSVQDDISTASPKHADTIVVTKPGMKNSLQSKLEYDKQRAARRLRMAKRRTKVPSVLVAAQKKAQEDGPSPKWGTGHESKDSTPQRVDSTELAHVTANLSSLDADPTIQEQTLVGMEADGSEQMQNDISPIISKAGQHKSSVPVETALESKCSLPPETTPKSRHDDSTVVKTGQTKAEVMKQLINKRRRRRKASRSGTRESIVEKKDPIDSRNLSCNKLAPGKDVPVLQDVDTNMNDKNTVNESKKLSSVRSIEKERDQNRSDKTHRINNVDVNPNVSESKQSSSVSNPDEAKGPVVKAHSTPVTGPDAIGTDDTLSVKERVAEADVSIPTQLPDNISDASNFSRSMSPVLETLASQIVPPQSGDIACVPPLPPDIIRSTQKEEDQEKPPIQLRSISSSEKGEMIQTDVLCPDVDIAPNSPSNSVSVASSLLQDYPDDEDEPEPVVDSFIDMELSPIRSQDVSKHDFDTSTSYRGSPDSHATSLSNLSEQHRTISRHVRNSTPRRANRHITNRSLERYLKSPVFAPNVNNPRSTRSINAPLTVRDSDQFASSEHETTDNITKSKICNLNPEKKAPIYEPCQIPIAKNHGDEDVYDSCSDIGISPTSSVTSSAVSAMSSRANKLLSERRSRSKKKTESESTVQESHAVDLARKIMKDSHRGNRDVSADSSSKHVSSADRVREEKGRDLKRETIAQTDKSKTETTRDNQAVSRFKSETTSCVSTDEYKSHDYTSSELDMDVDQIDSSLDHEEYEKSKAQAHFTCFSMACCNQNVDISDSLNFSTMSAVRISQETADDVPFDEETDAIEVEYISNENIAAASRANNTNSSILMHVNSAMENKKGAYFTSMPNESLIGKDRQTLNYVSESSEDMSDDM
jgi:hypothetical protein